MTNTFVSTHDNIHQDLELIDKRTGQVLSRNFEIVVADTMEGYFVERVDRGQFKLHHNCNLKFSEILR